MLCQYFMCILPLITQQSLEVITTITFLLYSWGRQVQRCSGARGSQVVGSSSTRRPVAQLWRTSTLCLLLEQLGRKGEESVSQAKETAGMETTDPGTEEERQAMETEKEQPGR